MKGANEMKNQRAISQAKPASRTASHRPRAAQPHGERTRLACRFRRLAENFVPPISSRGKEGQNGDTRVWAGRPNQHAGRVRSPFLSPRPWKLLAAPLAQVITCLLFFIAAFLLIPALVAADWPTYQHDAQRSGVTAEALALPLAPAWTFPKAAQTVVPAWPAEAEFDEYAKGPKLKPRFTFDRFDNVAVVGDRVFVGVAGAHAVRCLAATNGQPRWTFFADGPVRMAPTVAAGRVFFGADDGAAYCLEADTGSLVWKCVAAGSDNRLVPNDGRFVSPYAVRSGVVVADGTAYFGAGLFPSEGAWLCAVDAGNGEATGSGRWRKRFVNEGSFQGALLLTPERIVMPGGRSNPWLFDRATGALSGQFKDKKAMGTFAVLAGNSLLFGPASRGGAQLSEAGFDFKNVATYANATAAVVNADRIFLTSDTSLSALDRVTRKKVWSTTAAHPLALILAGETLFAGGDGEVAAFSAKTGEKVWSSPVPGAAGGLAVAHGRLYVSNDRGQVIAFATTP